MRNNQELTNITQTETSYLEEDINRCYNATGQYLNDCKEQINSEKVLACGNSMSNSPVCSDPRINQILSANTPNPIFAQPTSFTTYTNSGLGFSIDYPSDWVADENPAYGIVGIKDKMNAPDVLFEIKQMQSNGNSFDYMISKYVSESGVVNGNNYPINLQSKDKVTIDNKDAYRIDYTMTIGSAICNNEDYLINGGDFVTVISFDNCDHDIYEQFLSTYEKVVSTFGMEQTTTQPPQPNTSSQTVINATALHNLNNGMETILNQCVNTAISNSANCVNAINIVNQNCKNTLEETYPSYFPVCSDPRLQ